MQVIKNQIHRKTASNNPKSNEIPKANTVKLQQKQTNTQLVQKLACLQVLKKLVTAPSKSANHNNSKNRIRTEGNEKQFKQSVSPKKEKEIEQSASPPHRSSNSQADVITCLLNNNHTEYKRLSREQRNQSADFQTLLQQQQQKQDNRNWKTSGKKKFNSYGNLNDQVYFSQRSGLSECPSTLQLLQNTIEQKLMGLKGSSSMKQFKSPPPFVQQTQFLTTEEFKEKLSNLSREFKKRSNEEDIQKTQKKEYKTSNRYDHDDSEKRSKSLDSSSARSQIESKPNIDENFIVQTHSYLVQKKLENKIDQLVFQVQILKKKSEQLELQNKLLFENLSKFQQETDCSADERNLLMNKLDQMIGMQKRQEDNLNFFKQFFVKGCDQSRRIKTEQQQQQQEEDGIKSNQKTEVLSKQRPFVKSAYQGLDFNI